MVKSTGRGQKENCKVNKRCWSEGCRETDFEAASRVQRAEDGKQQTAEGRGRRGQGQAAEGRGRHAADGTGQTRGQTAEDMTERAGRDEHGWQARCRGQADRRRQRQVVEDKRTAEGMPEKAEAGSRRQTRGDREQKAGRRRGMTSGQQRAGRDEHNWQAGCRGQTTESSR
jgi:hypothetical protein